MVRSPRPGPWLAAFLLCAACAGCTGSWNVDVTIDRGTVANPGQVEFEVRELEAPGGSVLSTTEWTVPGVEFFATNGESNVLRIRVAKEAGAVLVFARARDASAALLGSGAITVERAPDDLVATMRLYEPGPLEIGLRVDGAFAPLTDGALVPLVLGANGLNMITPCLRAADADPRAPESHVEVTMAGVLAAAELAGERVDMPFDGTGYVLWDLKVAFQVEQCCINCIEGLVEARLVDERGKTFIGEVTVIVARAACPDPGVCCPDADYCVDPALALNICAQ